jgi:hypothetical protein
MIFYPWLEIEAEWPAPSISALAAQGIPKKG